MPDRKLHRIPNAIIAARVVLAFVAVLLLKGPAPLAGAAGVLLIVVVIVLDGLDGLAARKLGVASETGAVLDIAADRIVENVFWISFAVFGQVPLWVPLVVVSRGFMVDAARGLALARGKSAFGSATMMRSGASRFLTSSRAMRSMYGGAKVAAFVLLGVSMAFAGTALLPDPVGRAVEAAARAAALFAVALCVLRGVPVLIDGRAYLAGGPA